MILRNLFIFFITCLIFASMAFLFFWYQIKPSNIRATCMQKLRDFQGNNKVTVEAGNHIYRACLADYGLEPENLFDLSP